MNSESRQSSGIAPVRAFVVVVIFVIGAVVMVNVGSRRSVSGDVALPASTTTTTVKPPPVSTTTTTVAHASVSVLVANATGAGSLAAHYSTVLGAQGWAVRPPVDATTTEAASTVYYAAGQQESAGAIALALGLKPGVVQPLSASVPVTSTSGIDVVVIVGPDLAAQAGT
jgi:hypothetical protein